MCFVVVMLLSQQAQPVQLLYYACKQFVSLYTRVNNLSVHYTGPTSSSQLYTCLIPGLEQTIDGTRLAPLSMNELTRNEILARFIIRL